MIFINVVFRTASYFWFPFSFNDYLPNYIRFDSKGLVVLYRMGTFKIVQRN